MQVSQKFVEKICISFKKCVKKVYFYENQDRYQISRKCFRSNSSPGAVPSRGQHTTRAAAISQYFSLLNNFLPFLVFFLPPDFYCEIEGDDEVANSATTASLYTYCTMIRVYVMGFLSNFFACLQTQRLEKLLLINYICKCWALLCRWH